jgi:cysteinyl-tRNA synthetase
VGTRDLVQGEKEDEMDFALWKRDETPGASWESPWGRGRPGWHIECSAMSKKYLGASFDIHGGGRDLVFPHHENEIAQSEAANGCMYARYWLHSGLLTIEQRKMSKSLGNHMLISDFVQRFPGEVLRIAYLQSHYSSNVDFSEKVFRGAARRLLYFYESLQDLDRLAADSPQQEKFLPGHQPSDLLESFHQQMCQDFSTVGALREISLTFRKANELKQGKKSPSKSYTAKGYCEVLRAVSHVLGILQMDPLTFIERLRHQILKEMDIPLTQVETLIEERRAARTAKDYARGDELRKQLTDLGIELMDTPEGTRWTILWKEEEA